MVKFGTKPKKSNVRVYLYDSKTLNSAKLQGIFNGSYIEPDKVHNEEQLIAKSSNGKNVPIDDISNKKITAHEITINGMKYYHYSYEIMNR